MRYHEQIEAESAIVSIDRSYILGTWCRAIKAQPISGPSATKDLCEISLKEFRGKKFARADVIVSTPLSGGPIPRDNWVMIKNINNCIKKYCHYTKTIINVRQQIQMTKDVRKKPRNNFEFPTVWGLK